MSTTDTNFEELTTQLASDLAGQTDITKLETTLLDVTLLDPQSAALSSLCGVGALVYPVLNDFAEGTPQAPGSARVDSTVRHSMVSVNFIKSCVPGPATLAARESWGIELESDGLEFHAPENGFSICR